MRSTVWELVEITGNRQKFAETSRRVFIGIPKLPRVALLTWDFKKFNFWNLKTRGTRRTLDEYRCKSRFNVSRNLENLENLWQCLEGVQECSVKILPLRLVCWHSWRMTSSRCKKLDRIWRLLTEIPYLYRVNPVDDSNLHKICALINHNYCLVKLVATGFSRVSRTPKRSSRSDRLADATGYRSMQPPITFGFPRDEPLGESLGELAYWKFKIEWQTFRTILNDELRLCEAGGIRNVLIDVAHQRYLTVKRELYINQNRWKVRVLADIFLLFRRREALTARETSPQFTRFA